MDWKFKTESMQAAAFLLATGAPYIGCERAGTIGTIYVRGQVNPYRRIRGSPLNPLRTARVSGICFLLQKMEKKQGKSTD
jgi:hypothetical protein